MQLITQSELNDYTDIELRSKFCNMLNELRNMEGRVAELYQVRASVEAVREEISMRRIMKRPRGPGF